MLAVSMLPRFSLQGQKPSTATLLHRIVLWAVIGAIDVEKRELLPGDVVQLNPEIAQPMFSGCFLTVTEQKVFGCQGYVQCLGEDGKPGGQAFLRPTWAQMEYVGRAVFGRNSPK